MSQFPFRKDLVVTDLVTRSCRVVNLVLESRLHEFAASHRKFLREHAQLYLPDTHDHTSELTARVNRGLIRQGESAWQLNALAKFGKWDRSPSIFAVLGTARVPFSQQHPLWRRQAAAEGLRADAQRYVEQGNAHGRDEALKIIRVVTDALPSEAGRMVIEHAAVHALLDLDHAVLACLCAGWVAPSTGVMPMPLRGVLHPDHALALLRLTNAQLHVDELRHSRQDERLVAESEHTPDGKAVDPLVAAEGDEFVTALFHAVDALKEPNRSYVRDHVVDELPLEEIASRHGRSIHEVESGLNYALAALRVTLRNHM